MPRMAPLPAQASGLGQGLAEHVDTAIVRGFTHRLSGPCDRREFEIAACSEFCTRRQPHLRIASMYSQVQPVQRARDGERRTFERPLGASLLDPPGDCDGLFVTSLGSELAGSNDVVPGVRVGVWETGDEVLGGGEVAGADDRGYGRTDDASDLVRVPGRGPVARRQTPRLGLDCRCQVAVEFGYPSLSHLALQAGQEVVADQRVRPPRRDRTGSP